MLSNITTIQSYFYPISRTSNFATYVLTRTSSIQPWIQLRKGAQLLKLRLINTFTNLLLLLTYNLLSHRYFVSYMGHIPTNEHHEVHWHTRDTEAAFTSMQKLLQSAKEWTNE